MGAGASCVLPGLYLGSEELLVTGNYQYFAEKGIKHVVSLCESSCAAEDDWLPMEHHLRIEMRDTPDYNLSQHLPEIVDFIHRARTTGGGVFVHCKAGISRSATVVVAYVMSTTGMTTKDAFQHVQNCKGDVAPNEGFLRQLIVFGRRDRKHLHNYLMDTYGTTLTERDSEFVQHTTQRTMVHLRKKKSKQMYSEAVDTTS